MKTLILAFIVAVFAIAGMIVSARSDGGDETDTSTVTRAAFGAREFQCGAVTLRYEMREGPGWWQSHYTVINPDAVPYIRTGGVPYYFVEWNSSTRYGEYISLNGWRCVPR